MDLYNKNLIAFIGTADYVRTAYADLRGHEDIRLIERSCFDYYRAFCKRLHIKPLYFINLLLSWFYVLRYCRAKKNNIFLFHGVDYIWMIDLPLIALAKKMRGVKIVGYFWDVIDFESYSVPQYSDVFDLIFTIDENLALKYGCQYYPIFYSKEDVQIQTEHCDVFFCGEDGGRLSMLESVYRVLSDYGLKCDFYCSKSSNDGMIINGIKHIKQMPHSQYVSHINTCRVILDIVKPGITCCSLRFCEGVIYDKKVLTNNPSILNQVFYREEQFCVFDEKLLFNNSFFDSVFPITASSKYKVSPMRFVEHMYEKFDNNLNKCQIL